MSIPVLILGEPGSGKSSSARNFKRGELGIIQSIRKPLPFKNDLEVTASRDFEQVSTWLKNDHKHNAIMLDDFGYLITDIYMKHSYGTDKYRDQYEIYKEIGNKAYFLINDLMEDDQPDRIVYVTMHIERDAGGNIEPATVGKLLNEKVKLPGMFTIVLMSVSDSDGYRFVTNGQPLKSPPDMFELEIPNDLKAVDTAIREYWQMRPLMDKLKGKSAPKAGDAA